MTSQHSQASLEPEITAGGKPSQLGGRIRGVVFTAFVLCSLAWLGELARVPHPAGLDRLAEIALLLAAATTMLGLGRVLPLQNVFMIGGPAFLLSELALTLGASPGVFVYSTPQWVASLLCVVVILNARGVAHLILKPWEASPGHGLRVLGLAWLLATNLLCVARAGLQGMPMILVTPMILIVITPWWINKRPGRKPPLDPQPLAVWLVMSIIEATDDVVRQRWRSAGFVTLVTVLLTLFALRSHRRAPRLAPVRS